MEVTGSLVGGVGCKAGVCSKDLVKKIEIFFLKKIEIFTVQFSLGLLENGPSLCGISLWAILGVLKADLLNLQVTLILSDVG